jgi:hypothetical protein
MLCHHYPEKESDDKRFFIPPGSKGNAVTDKAYFDRQKR